MLFDVVVVGCVKAFVRRRRPPTKKADVFGSVGPDKFSFPSGHASRAVLIAVIFTHISPLADGSLVHVILSTLIWAWALTVCISRILNGRHYIGDVLGGAVAGFLESLVISYIWMSSEQAEKFLKIFKDDSMAVDV